MSGTPPNEATTTGAVVESRSIDHVPVAERHGRVWHLAPVWIAGNANLGTIAVGFLGIAVGGDLWPTIAATVLGSAFGAIFAALHSTQGPHLGLPQLIQSRPQFGYTGSALVFILALINYVGFNVFCCVLAAQSLGVALGIGTVPAVLLIIGVTLTLAIFGYTWIHVITRWVTLAFVIVFVIVTIVAAQTPQTVTAQAEFSWTPLLIQFGIAAGYQINWAIYVSDYTRYLPATVDPKAMFWCTYLGMAVSSAWLTSLGALLAANFGTQDAVAGVAAAGDALVPGFGRIAVLISLGGLVCVMTMNTYGGGLTLISVIDTFRSVRLTAGLRVAAVVIMACAALLLTVVMPEDYMQAMSVYLAFLLYLFAPWTAINLVDYFLVRRGRYSLTGMFDRSGVYRGWNRSGVLAYLLGLLVEIPLMSTGIFTGPLAAGLGGADIAAFAGLSVAGVAYWALNRGLDVDGEIGKAPATGDAATAPLR